jgi:predicted  nucleic acid-binding Zn-ribbon protein
MAKKSTLKDAAVRIGGALGTADRAAHKAVNAVHVTRQELADLQNQVADLAKQLQKASTRIRKALK